MPVAVLAKVIALEDGQRPARRGTSGACRARSALVPSRSISSVKARPSEAKLHVPGAFRGFPGSQWELSTTDPALFGIELRPVTVRDALRPAFQPLEDWGLHTYGSDLWSFGCVGPLPPFSALRRA